MPLYQPSTSQGVGWTRDTGGTTTASSSITPAAQDLIVCWWVGYIYGATTFTDTATCAGNGLTWTKQQAVRSADNKFMAVMFTTKAGSSTPSSGAVTVTFNTTLTSAGEAAIYVQRIPRFITSTGIRGNANYVRSGSGANTAATSMSYTPTAKTRKEHPRWQLTAHRAAETQTLNAGWASHAGLTVGTYFRVDLSHTLGSQDGGSSWTTSAISNYIYLETDFIYTTDRYTAGNADWSTWVPPGATPETRVAWGSQNV